jgi:tRNA A-37 threonylcarbamoyl transferase component Bud32
MPSGSRNNSIRQWPTGLAGYRCPQVFHGTRIQVHPEWQENFAGLGLTDLGNWRTPVDVRPVSVSKRAVACYRIPFPDGRAIYYKRYDYRSSWKARLRFWMRPSRAGVEQYGYRQFRKLGIETPEIVCFGESRILGTLTAAFIATEEVPAAVPLTDFVANTLPDTDALQARKLTDFAKRLLANLRKAHAACLFHYDLKWRNILIQQRDGEYYPVIIDCPRAFVSRLRRRYGITADLSALARMALAYLSLYQRYRLLAAYLGDSAGPAERKYWYRRVQKRYELRESKSAQPRDSLLRGVHFKCKI